MARSSCHSLPRKLCGVSATSHSTTSPGYIVVPCQSSLVLMGLATSAQSLNRSESVTGLPNRRYRSHSTVLCALTSFVVFSESFQLNPTRFAMSDRKRLCALSIPRPRLGQCRTDHGSCRPRDGGKPPVDLTHQLLDGVHVLQIARGRPAPLAARDSGLRGRPACRGSSRFPTPRWGLLTVIIPRRRRQHLCVCRPARVSCLSAIGEEKQRARGRGWATGARRATCLRGRQVVAASVCTTTFSRTATQLRFGRRRTTPTPACFA